MKSLLRFLSLGVLLFSPIRATAKLPNIVVIVSDDMGYSDIGCYGGEIRTPHIDALAENGLRFTNFYVNNMCAVTRASLLTGNYSQAVRAPGDLLRENCHTLPELLRSAGYSTMMAGKWHLGKTARAGKGSPLDRGFDHWYGIPGGAASFFDPFMLTRDGADVSHEARNNPDYYFTDAISDEAARMVKDSLENNPEQPFFLYLAYTAAHWPLHARASDIAKYEGKFANGWDSLREKRLARMKELEIVSEHVLLSPRHPLVLPWEKEPHRAWQQRRMEVFAAQVTVMDEGIGRIMSLLKQRGVF